MNQLPPPPTPADADLREFAFMPLDVLRLRDSEVAARSTGDEFRCAVLLWCAAWHQVPAGSLPDDDIVLSQLAGFGRAVKEWQKVRAGSLRNWYKCEDGRLYHPVVAEKAAEAWAGRVKYAEKKEAERHRKAEERRLKKAQDDANKAANEIPDNFNLSEGQMGNVQRTGAGNPPEIALKETVDSGQWTVDSGQLTTHPPESSSQASTLFDRAGQDDDDRLRPALPSARNVQIALLLRAQRIEVTYLSPFAVSWGQRPEVTDDVLNIAIAKAKAAKPNEEIPVKYVARIVDQLLIEQATPLPAPASPRQPPDWAWKRTNPGIEAKGRELGMRPRGTESYHDFAERIQQEIDKRKGAAA